MDLFANFLTLRPFRLDALDLGLRFGLRDMFALGIRTFDGCRVIHGLGFFRVRRRLNFVAAFVLR